MKLVFHGGAGEVGKSCIELDSGASRYLFDAGLKFKEDGFEAPTQIFDLPSIDALFLSHAHLDHTGALPMFEHYNMLCPIYTTDQTRELTKILLKDSFKIARIKHLHPAYEKMDLRKVYAASRIVDFNKLYKINDATFKFLNAGHIPGSAMILLNIEGKRVIYTGDFKYHSSLLMKGAETDDKVDFKDIDVLITESTYGGKQLPERKIIEEQFLERVNEVLKKGSVIIPVFALGRAQEILIILARRRWDVPIYYDGMCIDVTKKILSSNPANLNERKSLNDMYRKVDLVKKEKKREKIMNNHGIFITTSGMLQGGPIINYLESHWGNQNDAILMTGFQCKRTNGRMLLEEGYIYLNGWKTYVKCHIEKFDFSGHSDFTELQEFITMVNPKNIIINHGDPEAGVALQQWAEQTLQSKVYIPKVGDTLQF